MVVVGVLVNILAVGYLIRKLLYVPWRRKKCTIEMINELKGEMGNPYWYRNMVFVLAKYELKVPAKVRSSSSFHVLSLYTQDLSGLDIKGRPLIQRLVCSDLGFYSFSMLIDYIMVNRIFDKKMRIKLLY